MKEMACIWVPPIYKRLVSVDKKERDMSERCMIKIESIIFPPALTLSKVYSIQLFIYVHMTISYIYIYIVCVYICSKKKLRPSR